MEIHNMSVHPPACRAALHISEVLPDMSSAPGAAGAAAAAAAGASPPVDSDRSTKNTPSRTAPGQSGPMRFHRSMRAKKG